LREYRWALPGLTKGSQNIPTNNRSVQTLSHDFFQSRHFIAPVPGARGFLEFSGSTLQGATPGARSFVDIFYLPMVTKIDIFGLGSAPYDEVEFARRRRVRVRQSGEELWIKSPEDTVLRKLLWYREGGEVSEKQWRDVVEVLRIGAHQLDDAYLDAWASRLGVAVLLTRARRAF
jgi:hypothetical protein